MDKAKTTDEIIKACREAFDKFDFERVHALMIATDHTWGRFAGGPRVPTLGEVKNTVSYLIDKAIAEKRDGKDVTNQGTGGFSVYMFPWGVRITYNQAWCEASSF